MPPGNPAGYKKAAPKDSTTTKFTGGQSQGFQKIGIEAGANPDPIKKSSEEITHAISNAVKGFARKITGQKPAKR